MSQRMKGGKPLSQYQNDYQRERSARDPEYADRMRISRAGRNKRNRGWQTEELTDTYIIGLIANHHGISAKEVRSWDNLQDVLDVKRAILILKRANGRV